MKREGNRILHRHAQFGERDETLICDPDVRREERVVHRFDRVAGAARANVDDISHDVVHGGESER